MSSVLSQLSTRLEEATDEYIVACNDAAVKENAYLKAYAVAFTTSEVAATIRPKTAECAAVEERAVWNIAVAVERSARAKVEELKNRMMAAASHQKFVMAQT